MRAKRIVYVAAFVFLGVLLQQLVHAGLEIVIIRLLVADFDRYGLGLSWHAWYTVHAVGSFVLLLCGIIFGWWQGRYWWVRIYGQAGPRELFSWQGILMVCLISLRKWRW